MFVKVQKVNEGFNIENAKQRTHRDLIMFANVYIVRFVNVCEVNPGKSTSAYSKLKVCLGFEDCMTK